MKKLVKFAPALMVVFASFFLVSASIWEGAAAVSAEFPAGLYVATNSFPRNTVVDVTNLETGKTVRAIVSAGLESPGLLALLSREAAEKISLQSRSIGRIRMTQPSDPIAYSRFTEDHLRSGDPDYDPRAALESYGDPVYAQTPETAPAPAEAAGNAIEEAPPAVIPAERPVKTPVEEDHSAGQAETSPADIAEANYPDPAAAWGDSQVALLSEPSSPAPEAAPAYNEPVMPFEEPAPVVVAPTVKPAPEPEPEQTPALEPHAGGWSGDSSGTYTLESSSMRPPVVDWASPDPSIAWAGAAPDISAYTPPAADLSLPQEFSVPTIGVLEQDKYYLQLGAYSKTGAVEKELAKIGRNLPLAVQRVSASGKPVYRILVGPVNHGESGALLQKFKTNGYRDAFIRSGGSN
ncbi:MAG: SPOR domain-containing protein [Treponema sp.]|jgi:hypothetical protein|nr:SPOR domain-containing protein [Treponema sp.]